MTVTLITAPTEGMGHMGDRWLDIDLAQGVVEEKAGRIYRNAVLRTGTRIRLSDAWRAA